MILLESADIWVAQLLAIVSFIKSCSTLATCILYMADVLCDPTDLIWWKGAPFKAMTGRTAASSYGLLAEVSQGFPQL